MKLNFRRNLVSLVVFSDVVGFGRWQPMTGSVSQKVCALAEGERIAVRPKDTGEALENPGMGWVFHYYDNVPQNYGSRLEPSDTLDDYPGLTVIYLRIPWSYIEPEEGKFDWSVVDTPAQRWTAKGKEIAFRFSCAESWMRWATPEWVQKAGAKGYEFEPGKGVTEKGPFWEPDYDDPIFLEKLDRFLAAAAARYDGNPEVAFIDVGSFGVWGEGHTYHSSALPFSAATVKKHLDLHVKHFKRTLLAANDDFASQGRGMETIDYARERGLTLRDDSILVQGGKNAYFNAAMAQGFWMKVPVILESEHYGGSRNRGNWKDGSQYLQAVEDYHASYASVHWWPREFLSENRELINRINERLGYRLQLVEASWPSAVRMGGTFRFTGGWRNAGVAPCLPSGFPAATLRDTKGGIAGVFVDGSFDVRHLPVGAPGQGETRNQDVTFSLPFNLKPGIYDLYSSIGTRTGSPRIALPLSDSDGHRRYRLGIMRVTGDYDVKAGGLQRQGEQWVLPATWTINEPLPAGVTPFCHLEIGGQIIFQGNPDPRRARQDLEKPGAAEIGFTIAVPKDAKGKTLEVKVGLWVPERIGRPDERMVPDNGEMDRRVVVGTLLVGQDGAASFVPAKASP